MQKLLVILAALGLGIGGLLNGGGAPAAADTLVPGGWLQPIQIPQPAPPPPVAATGPQRPAPRRIIHSRARAEAHHPAGRPAAPPADGQVRF
jgi:hypothetical protein